MGGARGESERGGELVDSRLLHHAPEDQVRDAALRAPSNINAEIAGEQQ